MTTAKKKSESAEFGVLLTILGAVAVMAGAASFTHVHDFTMKYSPTGTHDWFGWANAVISELTPIGSMLVIRHKLRKHDSIKFPLFVLALSGAFSLTAQVSEAKPSLFGWLVMAAPAIALALLAKMALSLLDRKPAKTAAPEALGSESPAVQAPPVQAPAVQVSAPGIAGAEAPVPAVPHVQYGTLADFTAPSRPADLYRLSFTDGDREPPSDLLGSTPGRTESDTPQTAAGGWPTRLPQPRNESATETPAGSTETPAGTTPGGTESGTGTDREPVESTGTTTESSRESDVQTPAGSDATTTDNAASGDESDTNQDAGDGDAGDELTPTERARAHWDAERAAGRVPSGAELDRVAGTKDYGRGLRRKWLADEAEAEGRLHAV